MSHPRTPPPRCPSPALPSALWTLVWVLGWAWALATPALALRQGRADPPWADGASWGRIDVSAVEAAAPRLDELPAGHPWEGVLVPGGAAGGPRAVRVRGDLEDLILEQKDDALPFSWRLTPVAGRFLDFIRIQEEGATLRPMSGAHLLPAEGRAAILHREIEGRRLELEFSNGVEVVVEPFGRCLRIDLYGPPSGGGGEFDLGGVLPGVGVWATRALRVPYNDLCGVAAVHFEDGALRYLASWVDPVISNASRLAIAPPGERRASGALRLGNTGEYLRDTEGGSRPLRERIWLAYSDRLVDVLPAMQRAPSPFRPEAGQLFYLKLHQWPFADAAADLRLCRALGMRDVHVSHHKWQKDGYDAGYPNDVMPPRVEWGGLEGLLDVRAAAREAGYSFCLHHNWVFNGERLVGGTLLDSSGGPSTGPGGGHFLKSSFALALVDEVEGEIQRTFDTRGSFSDSLSAILPHADQEAGVHGVGLIRKPLFDWYEVSLRLRAIHGAPLMGENGLGFGGVLWAGLFDVTQGLAAMVTEGGALETFGVRQDVVPEFVLTRLNPLNLRMGAGPTPKHFCPGQSWSEVPVLAEERDQLLALSALYGAAGFFFWHNMAVAGDAARDWWSHSEAARALTDPDQKLLRIDYADFRGRLIPLSRKLALGESLEPGSVRCRVEYEDGTLVFGNLTPEPWSIELPGDGPRRLAPWGRLIATEALEAGLVLEDGAIVEYSQGAERRFLDGRGRRVERFGLVTDGALGIELLGPGHLALYAFEYQLSATVDRIPHRVAPETIEVLPAALGVEPGRRVRIDYRGLDTEVLESFHEELPAQGLELSWRLLRRLGAHSVVLAVEPPG